MAHDPVLSSALNHLLESDEITHPAAIGIAKRVADKGLDSLVGGQQRVYDHFIAPLLNVACTSCGEPVELHDFVEAYENDGACQKCRNGSS